MDAKNIIGGAVFGVLVNALGVYLGPISISLLAALARLLYSGQSISIKNFLTIWGMSLFVAIVAMHLTQWKALDRDFSVALWGSSAFMAKEVCDFALWAFKKAKGRIWEKANG